MPSTPNVRQVVARIARDVVVLREPRVEIEQPTERDLRLGHGVRLARRLFGKLAEYRTGALPKRRAIRAGRGDRGHLSSATAAAAASCPGAGASSQAAMAARKATETTSGSVCAFSVLSRTIRVTRHRLRTSRPAGCAPRRAWGRLYVLLGFAAYESSRRRASAEQVRVEWRRVAATPTPIATGMGCSQTPRRSRGGSREERASPRRSAGSRRRDAELALVLVGQAARTKTGKPPKKTSSRCSPRPRKVEQSVQAHAHEHGVASDAARRRPRPCRSSWRRGWAAPGPKRRGRRRCPIPAY